MVNPCREITLTLIQQVNVSVCLAKYQVSAIFLFVFFRLYHFISTSSHVLFLNMFGLVPRTRSAAFYNTMVSVSLFVSTVVSGQQALPYALSSLHLCMTSTLSHHPARGYNHCNNILHNFFCHCSTPCNYLVGAF